MQVKPRVFAALAVALICACSASTAPAKQSVRLSATLSPEALGHGTTLGFDFRIRSPHGHVPSPVVAIALRYPENFGIGTSDLGVETCRQADLDAIGLRACPANSLMGSGAATVEIAVGPDVVHEVTKVTVVRAPVRDERFALIFYADGISPVLAQISLPALLLEAANPFGGQVSIHLPLVPSLPESPDLTLVHLHAEIGPEHLTYYEHVHGRTVAYHPRGILLPKSCPHGGFPFSATFAFLDHTHHTANAVVPCPPHG